MEVGTDLHHWFTEINFVSSPGVYLLGLADVVYKLNFIQSFAFGSLISAVDPVATDSAAGDRVAAQAAAAWPTGRSSTPPRAS